MHPIITSTFRIAIPFWRNAPQRHMAWLLALVAVAASSTGLNAWLNHLNKAFYDALQNLDARAFNESVLLFLRWSVCGWRP